MRRVSDTIARLAAAHQPASSLPDGADRLTDLTEFGSDPGQLRGLCYVPAGLEDGAALVVALHGCTQTAAGYDHGTGWSALADRAGFALLVPEQRQANNANRCFNWFEPGDMARLGGEPESIAQMVQAMLVRHRLDPARVFITGLSAGGAMTAVMLATWPELFAAGAIIGGLPYRAASGVPQALDRMRGHGWSDDAAAAAAVRAAPGHDPARWPRVAIWHGTDDRTVVDGNMERLAAQWRTVHGLPLAPNHSEHGRNWHHRRWEDASGEPLVETWSVEGMGHGVPIDPNGTDRLGAAGPFMLDVGIASSAIIARGWGLAPLAATAPAPRKPTAAPPPPRPAAAAQGLQDVIEKALRAAGLMR
ncbi:LpqC, poly [Sphingomonas metalli]|uniref:LpqC, poly n=1 Tax=Sphingomonas metalli TaxID=1779358 RepID=A0A916WQS5_9SPHN|nr:PHB depolymerase family esterase [Sphingomonas metalli]GGB20993.1 LpqC, poly [Sphingomonas metalli]